MFKRYWGDWRDFRKLSKFEEHSMHWLGTENHLGYYENMAQVLVYVEKVLRIAQKNEKLYVIFCHGKSTSRNGATTTRSQVRKFMRSKAATSLIIRNESIQHDSAFVAAIRPLVAVST